MVEIGKCKACRLSRRLEDGACNECIARGERWVGVAMRVQTDPIFALRCYNAIETREKKLVFIEKYGLPEGGQDVRPNAQIIPFRR